MLIDLSPCGCSVFFWQPEPMRMVRAFCTERSTWASESSPRLICSLLLQRNYFSHIMKACTEIINFNRARGQGRNALPHTSSPESTRDLLLGSDCNIKQKIKDLLRNSIAEVLFTAVAVAAHTQLLLLGVPPARAGWCKAFFKCLHNEELPSRVRSNCFQKVNIVHFC